MEHSKDQFPALQQEGYVYLDSAATTQMPIMVEREVRAYFSELKVNPGRGMYDPAVAMEQRIAQCRQRVARFIGAERDEIIFISGATEAITMVAYGWGLHHLQDGDEIVLCEEDHGSTVHPWVHIQAVLAKRGVRVVLRHYRRDPYMGTPDMEHMASLLTEHTKMVVVTHIHNVYGTIADVKAIRTLVGKDAYILVDACQSISHVPIDVKELGVDFLCFSGHKMFSMMGTGVCFAHKRTLSSMEGFVVRGGEKEGAVCAHGVPIWKRMESGTPNVPGILALASAIQWIESVGFAQIDAWIQELTAYLYAQLATLDTVEFLPGYAFDMQKKGYGIISFQIQGVPSVEVGERCNHHGIYLRTGHHCLASQRNGEDSVRASLHVYNTKEDIDALVAVLEAI